MEYTFWYDQAGNITLYSITPSTVTPPTGYTALNLTDTDTPSCTAVAANTKGYQYDATTGKVVEVPYFTLSATESTTTAGQWTVTAALNQPPVTPPTSCVFSVAGTAITETITSNQASVTLALDAIVQNQSIYVSVAASGVVSASVSVGQGGNTTPLQAIAPTTAGDPYRITTTSKAYAAEAYLSQSQADLAAILGSLQTLVQMLIAEVYGKGGIRESLAQTTYTQIPFDSAGNEQNALADMQSNLIPSIGWLLSNVYPSGGTQDYHYAATKVHLPNTTSAAQQYAKFVAETPNLA